MLLGQFLHNVDKKGRIFIPAKLREELGEGFTVCKGIERECCLFVYSSDEWAALDEKIKQLPNMKASKVKHFVYTGASTLECDTQGRVLIPQNLREYAKIDGEACILGMSDHLEIWNKELWSKVDEECTSDAIADIMEELDF
ncbi:MAG: division/cell wall cluster transcriptional repressor MraZ [bacterium]|nr:division/cell wall cluster transcriptional repressor MraZ [bacterium]